MLDIRTVLTLTVFYNLLFGITIISFGIKRNRNNGVVYIGSGFISIGMGFLLISYRNYINEYLSIILANFLIIFGLSLILVGLTKYKQIDINWKIQNIFIYISFIILFYIFTKTNPNLKMRIVIIILSQLIFLCEMIYILNIKKIDIVKKQSFIVSLFFIFALILNIIRLLWTLLEIPFDNFMNASTIHSISVMIYQGFPFNLSLGLFWLTNTRIENELKTQAMTDSLTGLYNRLAFIQLFEKEIGRVLRTHKSIGVIMCDIDHFKDVNDKYGHQVGDKVLKEVSNILKSNIRINDVIARYGGEEFILVLSGVNKENLNLILENLRRKIEEYDYSEIRKNLFVTMSFGAKLQLLDNEKIDKEDLIKLADEALYIAKNSGRNKVVISNK